MKKNLVSFLLTYAIFSASLFAQNTLNYTDAELHYRNGIELFEKKAYTAAREEFQTYIQKTGKSIHSNDFNLSNAEYYSALSGLYTKAQDAEIELDRFVINNSQHPKAKVIYGDLAQYFYDQGDYEKAITYYERAIENTGDELKMYEYRYKLGMSYYQMKQPKNALPQFNFVKGSISEFAVHASYYAGVINFQNENLDAALLDFKKVENVAPYRIEAPNWIAQILFRQKKYDELLAYTEPILAKPNGRKIDDICLVTAEVNFFKNDYTKAAKYYDMFRNFRRGTVSNQVTFRHGYSLFKTNEFKKAAENFKKIAAQNNQLGQQASYYLGISSLKAADMGAASAAFDQAKNLEFDKEIKEEALFNFAKVQVDMGSNVQAINELQNYLKNYPNGKYEDEANEILSDILFDSNNYSQAIAYIEGLKRKTPKINAAYQRLCFNQGVLDFNGERFAKAISYFDKSLTQPIDNDLKQKATFWRAEAADASKSPEAERLYLDILKSGDETYKQKSRYSLGYLYYNQKEYGKAMSYFKEFTKVKKDEANRQSYEDAIVRIGDCYLVTKNYDEALKYYNTAINENRSEKDYALYQKALTLTFLGKNQEAQQIYDRLATAYPNSRMVDDALFQNGSIEIEKGNYQNAVNILTKMIRERPKSTLIPNALMKRATAFNNLKNYDAAVNDYKIIITRYGNSSVTQEAILGLQETLNTIGRPEDFSSIIEEYRKNNPEDGSVAGIEYDAAKNLYLNEKYDKAVQALIKYINNYPTSTNVYEAKYYLADSYYLLKDNRNALIYYNQVVSDNRTSFVTKSALRAAAIEFANKSYKNAITDYRTVTLSSSNKREIVTAWLGLLDCYYLTGNQDSVQVFCREIVNNGGNVVLGANNKAQLYLGKSFMQKGDLNRAEEEFKKTVVMAKDVNGAEANYFIGDIQYKQRKHDQSIKTLQAFADDYSNFAYWYEKAYMLIAENYISLEKYFQAKVTLKSVIENAETPDNIIIAKKRLQEIEDKE
ncbi:MAG: tetratricopeptide repeat protein [Spirosomataceae bacterium]